MRDDELDRLLAGTPLPDPGPAFTRAVMERVRREAAAPEPIPFPWWRLAVGLALCGALVVVAFLAFVPSAVPLVPDLSAPPRLDAAGLRPALFAAATLFASWLSLRVTAIFSGARA
jgi:hypothetical protein